MLNNFYKYLPLYIFLGIWGIVFFLYNLQLFNIYPASSETILLILYGILAFTLGYILLAVYDIRNIPLPERSLDEVIDPKGLFLIVFSLSLITLIGSAFVFIAVSRELGGYDVYFRIPIAVRNQIVGYQLDPLTPPPFLFILGNYLINIGFAGTLFGGVLFTLKSRWRFWGIIIVISFFVASLVTVGRYTLFNSLFFFVLAYVLSAYFLPAERKRKKLIEITIYTILFFAFLSLFTLFLMDIRTTISTQSAVKEYALKTSYLYITGGITALDNFLAHDFSYVYGQSSFRSLFKWLVRFDLWPESSLMYVHEPFTSVTPSIRMNTYTFAKSFYEDFGITGILFLSFSFGAICKIANYYYLRSFSFIRMSIVLTLSFTAMMTFYSFYLHSVTTALFRILIVVLVQYAFIKKIYK